MACNLSRVGVLNFGASQLNARLIAEGVPQQSEDRHMIAHAAAGAAKPQYGNVLKGEMNQVAQLIKGLKDMKIGDRTAFDETLIMVSTDVGAPADHHGGDNIATLMFGNLGGTLKGNRYIKLSRRPYNHALITAAHLIGVTDITTVGNTSSVGPLAEVMG